MTYSINEMSYFYLSPSRGKLPLHFLEECTLKRHQYLERLCREGIVEYSEFMIEGSIFDSVGHYMLKIITNLHSNNEFTNEIIRGEMQLFKRRILLSSPYDLRNTCKKVIKLLKKHRTYYLKETFYSAMFELCQRLILKEVAAHVTSKAHAAECVLHKINIKFTLCLPFIAERKVEVCSGNAAIGCGRWFEYLFYIYKLHLKKAYSENLSYVKNDPRIMDIVERFSENKSSSSRIKSIVLSNQIDYLSSLFPPCMKHLHKSLRTKHRLSHDQRFRYSLFLKDVGLSLEEAIKFWKCEYMKNPCNTAVCTHSWEKDEKKYLYGIRHLYGLEGGRKQYKSVNCACIQSSCTATSEGGCPFKSFDSDILYQILDLPGNSEDVIKSIEEKRQQRKFTNACSLYLNDLQKKSFDFVINSPIEFYSKFQVGMDPD